MARPCDLRAAGDGEPAVLPVIGEIDAGQRQREQEPGDGVLQMVVGDVETRLAADRQAARVGRGIGVEEEGVELRVGLAARHAAHQRHVDMEPDVLVRNVLRRELAALLVAAHDAGEIDAACDLALRALGRILLLLRDPAAVEQHDAAVVGAERRHDLQADLVLEVAGGEVELLVVQERARHLHPAVLLAQRIAAQQLVERDRRGRLVDLDAMQDVAASMRGAPSARCRAPARPRRSAAR